MTGPGGGSGAPRTDAHHHLWDLDVRDQPWTAGLPALRRSFSLDDLRPHLAATGVERTVVVQTVCVAAETPELLALAESEPVVAGVVGWVDLTAADVAERLEVLKAMPGGAKLVSTRHQVQEEPDPMWLCRDDVRRGLRAVAAAGLAYDLVVRPHQLPAVLATVAALGELRFVVDHAAKPPVASGELSPWAAYMRELSRMPNVAVKLSGLESEAGPGGATLERLRPFAEVVLGLFGPERTAWGSDWPVCLVESSYEGTMAVAEALTSSCSAPEKAAIFGGTATSWYSLGPQRGRC